MPIDPLPQPPSRSDPQNFAARGDAFMAALPTFAAQANALQLDVNLKEEAATTAAISASDDAQAAALAASDAQSSKNAAANSASEAQTARDAALGYRDDAAESALAAANSAASVDLANLSTDYFGPDEPVTMWPGMTWAHTTNPEMTEGYLKRRNAANTAWVVEGKLFVDSTAPATQWSRGIIRIATADEAQAMVNDESALTPWRLREAFSGPNRGLTGNGYQKLPSGLIIQWGGGVANASGNFQAALPIAFPAQQIGCVATVQGEASPNTCISVFSLSTTGFDIRVRSVAGAPVQGAIRYIAVGY